MGWDFGPMRHATKQAECDAQFNWSDDGATSEVVVSAMVGRVHYAAVRHTLTGQAPTVIACITLTEGNKHDFGMKNMTETMGPNESRAPAEVLAALDPDETLTARHGAQLAEWALAWRNRCRANLQALAA
jgi:hypothetical protein